MGKILKVGDKYRTNNLSLIEGGSTVEIHLTDGRILVYDKVKNPIAYINMIRKKSDVEKAFVNGVAHKL
jgi:hypothetical protein